MSTEKHRKRHRQLREARQELQDRNHAEATQQKEQPPMPIDQQVEQKEMQITQLNNAHLRALNYRFHKQTAAREQQAI